MKYLVAVDGSSAANEAAFKAASMAKSGDEVIIMCVVDLTHYILSQPLAVESTAGFEDMKHKMVEQGNEVIAKYKNLVPESKLNEVTYTFVVAEGNPREVLVQKNAR
eukprot:TRINITY_DN2897_c0_g1_i1.p1 TRINITY_DN2897_c0_g1~~TRINITY_DN2897_c0_g1_i1.p1  ORF type:complete len:107 (-),score=28.63 TRINITY_DN2897_c0_g1_i1:125-445(-)